jgi:hypothetical protein
MNKPLTSPSLKLNEPVAVIFTKPIGYERHEKQFKSSNQNLDQIQGCQPNAWMLNNSIDLLSILLQNQMVINQQQQAVPVAALAPGLHEQALFEHELRGGRVDGASRSRSGSSYLGRFLHIRLSYRLICRNKN